MRFKQKESLKKGLFREPDGFRTHNIHIHSVALCR